MQANASLEPGPQPTGLLAHVEPDAEGSSVQWLLKRNCSIAPRPLLRVYLGLSALSLGIASFFGWQGAPWVLAFAGIEVLALGVALVVHGRHATDRERIALARGRLTVECRVAERTERVEFAAVWVRVDPGRDERSLVELSGEGRRVAVGRHLQPAMRRRLVLELRAALQQAAGAEGPPPAARTDRVPN